MSQLGQAVKEIRDNSQAGARVSMQNQVTKMEADRRALTEEINILRSLKINDGLVNNMKALASRADREAVRIGRVPSTPGTSGPKDKLTYSAGRLSAQLKELSDATTVQNDSVDKMIAFRRTEIEKINVQIQQMRKGVDSMKGNAVEDSKLVQDIKATFWH
jgi:hypothetical protein